MALTTAVIAIAKSALYGHKLDYYLRHSTDKMILAVTIAMACAILAE